ncbi:outer membrane protein transport protein, partial [Vibrio vulnificus]|uniref:outer membrane protein transport protein n=1 Tax=Vibrio vulnificus TaxID=672 RepID=UPI00057CEB57
DVTYSGTFTGPQDVANTDDVSGTSIAPNIHFIMPVNDKFAWGVNAYSNFGTKTEFADDYVAAEYGGLTDVKSFNFGLAGSYRLNQQWSFGAGLDLIYGQGTMKRVAGKGFPGTPVGPVPVAGTPLLDVDKADGWAVGFNVGTVYELDENNRFGLS